MQQSPSSSNESNPSIQSGGDQSPQPNEQFDPLNQIYQALAYIDAGFGVEFWVLNAIWPGVCAELFWHDLQHPNTLSSAATTAIDAMFNGQSLSSRRFDCPVFVAETRHGWPRTCNNVKSANMSELRRHLTERPGYGYTPQLQFLKLCRTCNEDFIDKEVFESQHGYKGELCNNRKIGRRKAHAQVQWQLLYHHVEAAMVSQHLEAHTSSLSNNYENGIGSAIREENDNISALPGPSASIPLPPTPHNDGVEPLVGDPIPCSQNEAMPYLTPYQLIVDSDSEDEESSIEPQHTSSSVASGINQNAPFDAFSEFEHGPLHTYSHSGIQDMGRLRALVDIDTLPQDSQLPSGVRDHRNSSTQMDTDEIEGNSRATRMSPSIRHGTPGDNSEVMSPLISDTALLQLQGSTREDEPSYLKQMMFRL
ncbi:hypothetical protein J3E72DRAFT_411211 [Bipolaris maydis]|nr:hypothetical protein J3E74DRAFT_434296 [Bipolaris maydis]KAJ6200100.1 hypothetical protein J3E72DRAFT_411211 [Bipolaris maydis]